MPRHPAGDHALTAAERQAHQRAKRRERRQRIVALLEAIAQHGHAEVRAMAREALTLAKRG